MKFRDITQPNLNIEMRYHEILNEKITNGSRRLTFFLTRRLKEIDSIIAASNAATDTIKTEIETGDAEYLISYALRFLNNGERLRPPESYELDLTKCYNLANLRDSIECILKYGPDRFLKYAIDNLKYIEPVTDEPRQALRLMPNIDQGLREYGFEPDDPDPDHQAALKLASAYNVISKNLPKVELIIDQLRDVFHAYMKILNYNHRPHEYRPDHEDVETLYHATLYASEIVRQGFAAEKPEDRRGLGNLGTQSEISFTHDIKIAHDIMRAFREMWMIVHGQLKRQDIIKWLKAENIDLNKASSFFMRSGEDPNTIEQTIRLFRAYLSLSKIRTDPVLISPEELIPRLKECSFKDIGIVSCPVKLNDGETYHFGEAEFRVNASQVLGPIKRVD